ncbi:MAG: Zn-ribbon domain-containing OB-fold protein [Chloroflexi bacterium]|nr:Zn-ribbon domain-containing OB-fold protein [Chloroflexota bacterium]
MTEVTSKRDVIAIDSPSGDPWSEFRQVELVDLHFEQDYVHSLGKVSRFFLELEQGRLFGTRCPACARVYLPPRPTCPDCQQITSWYEMPLTGTVKAFSIMHFGSAANPDVERLGTPYVLAYVLHDGASTLMPHILKADPTAVEIGMPVQVAFADGPVSHPIHLMYYVYVGA